MRKLFLASCLAVISFSIISVPLRAADSKAEDVLANHLRAIGSPEAVAAAKTSLAQGAAIYKVLVGGSGQLSGNAVLASDGLKTHLLLKAANNRYMGERFVSNGEKTSVAAGYADKTYSEFGDFLKGQDLPLRDGLLGGVLTTAWPLLNLEGRKASVSYEGMKRIDGHELQVLRYKPRKSSDLSVLLYFDKDSFRHVMTTYVASIQPRIGLTDETSSREQQSRYRIEERFSDFKTVDGLTLPSHYDLRFTEELAHGFTKAVEWDVSIDQVTHNMSLDPRNFSVK